MNAHAYISGKIETKNGLCMVGDEAVPCPSRSLFGGQTQSGDKLDLLPNNFIADARDNGLFGGLFTAVVIIAVFLVVSRTKIFDKTLSEYLRPIWYYVLLCLLVVAWQYIFGVSDAGSMALRISQWVWELAIALSVIQLVRKNNFGFGNICFLGILYSFIIHGTKISIRYFLYGKTLLYALDRFLYGSLLVMVIVVGIGFATLLIINKKP